MVGARLRPTCVHGDTSEPAASILREFLNSHRDNFARHPIQSI
jgi:hypothetical protein